MLINVCKTARGMCDEKKKHMKYRFILEQSTWVGVSTNNALSLNMCKNTALS